MADVIVTCLCCCFRLDLLCRSGITTVGKHTNLFFNLKIVCVLASSGYYQVIFDFPTNTEHNE